MPFSHGQNEGDLRGKLESLLAPLDKLRIALNVANQGIVVFDGEQFCYLNRVAEDLLNLKDSELVGCPLREVPLSNEVRQALVRALESSRAGSTPFREQIVLGPDLYMLEAKEAAGAITLVTFEGRARAEKPLQTRPVSGKDSLSVSTFLHLAALVARELPPDSEGARLCRDILESVTNADASALGTGKSDNYRDDLFTVCRDVANLLKYSLGPGYQVEQSIPEGASSSDFPGEALRRLILAACMSSAREISEGGTLHLSAREGEDSAVFEVRTSSASGSLGTTDEKGVKSLRDQCEALGGHIVVWSESGKRVRLINLPFSDDRAAEVENTPNPLSNNDGKGKSVLLIDDEDAIRAVGRAALSRIGYTVYLAKDGVEGVEVYRQHKDEIDLVLLDLVMPRLGGAGCFEQLKEINPEVKVVLMSGFTRNHRVNDLMESGCLHFLRKPFELTDLLAITRDVTSGRPPGRGA